MISVLKSHSLPSAFEILPSICFTEESDNCCNVTPSLDSPDCTVFLPDFHSSLGPFISPWQHNVRAGDGTGGSCSSREPHLPYLKHQCPLHRALWGLTWSQHFSICRLFFVCSTPLPKTQKKPKTKTQSKETDYFAVLLIPNIKNVQVFSYSYDFTLRYWRKRMYSCRGTLKCLTEKYWADFQGIPVITYSIQYVFLHLFSQQDVPEVLGPLKLVSCQVMDSVQGRFEVELSVSLKTDPYF